jgi:hypothetical protein
MSDRDQRGLDDAAGAYGWVIQVERDVDAANQPANVRESMGSSSQCRNTLGESPVYDPHGTRVAFTLDFEGHGFGKPLVPLLRRQAQKSAPPSYQASRRSSSKVTSSCVAR